MIDKKIEDLTEPEFRGMLSYMASDEFDRLTLSEFFDVLAEMEETEQSDIMELTGHLEGGQLVLEEPAPVPVSGNEIQVGGRRIVIKLH